MKQRPLVSVVLPVYNGARFLKETIDSIVGQSYNNLEIIIIDDASSDTSREIIDSYVDERIVKIYKDKNENICSGSNQAFAMAKGKYCALIGHDDVWKTNKIELQVEYLEEHEECGTCFTRCNVIDHNGELINATNMMYGIFNDYMHQSRYQTIQELYLKGNRLCAPSALIRMDILKNLGGYNYTLLQTQDYELWLRVLSVSDIYIMEEHLVDYRQILDTNSNLSAMSAPAGIRNDHEWKYIQDDFLYRLDDDVFHEAFHAYFLYQGARTAVELQCEKMLLLRRMNNPYWPSRCMALLNDEPSRRILESIYGYTLQMFYNDNSGMLFDEFAGKEKQIMDGMKNTNTLRLLKIADLLLQKGEVAGLREVLVNNKDKILKNEKISLLKQAYAIHDEEIKQKENTIFEGRHSIAEIEECVNALKSIICILDIGMRIEPSEFMQFVLQYGVSSSAIIHMVEAFAVNKADVLKVMASNFIEYDEYKLAKRILFCAYRYSQDDSMLFHLAYVLWMCQDYEQAASVADRIKNKTEDVLALIARVEENRKCVASRKIKVAFIVQMLELWDKQAPVYEAMSQDELFETFLIVVPEFGISEWKLKPYGDERSFLRARYPQANIIDAIAEDGSTLELKVGQFDYVFYPRPYDVYLPEGLQSKIVKLYAKTCYIPYCYQGSVAFEDLNTKNDFFGNIHMSFCDSDVIRDTVMRKIKKGVEMGMQKVYSIGYPIFDTYFAMEDKKEANKILWTPRWLFKSEIGGSKFVAYKDDFVALRDKYPNMDVEIRPHPLMWDNVVNEKLMTREEVVQYKLRLQQAGITIDQNKMVEDTIRSTKVLITDFSSIIISYFMTGKPIIYCPLDIEVNEIYQRMLPGMYIANSWADVEKYLDMIARGEDVLYETRQEIICKERERLVGGTVNIVQAIKEDFGV